MFLFICAQVDVNNIVKSISRLKGEIKGNNIVQLEEYDSSLLGKRYNPETGEFEEVERPREKTDEEKRLEELEEKDTTEMTSEEKIEELLLQARLRK